MPSIFWEFRRKMSTDEFTLRLQFIFKYLKSQNKRVLSQTLSTKPHTNFMHFFVKTLWNCDNQSFQEHTVSMKICLHIMEKLQTLNHLLGIFCQKENILVQRNSSYCRIIFPEVDRGTLQNIRWSTLQQDLTACRH